MASGRNWARFLYLMFRLWVSRLWVPYQRRLDFWEWLSRSGDSWVLYRWVYLALVEFSPEKAAEAVEKVKKQAERRKEWLRKLEGVEEDA